MWVQAEKLENDRTRDEISLDEMEPILIEGWEGTYLDSNWLFYANLAYDRGEQIDVAHTDIVRIEAGIMFQVMYEYKGNWPDDGQLRVQGQFMEKDFSAVIEISPTEAKRKANNYLSRDISTGIYADDPVLIWGDTPRWRLALSLRIPTIETTEIPGAIEVNALTGDIIALSTDKLKLILDMANDIAQRLTLAAAPAS